MNQLETLIRLSLAAIIGLITMGLALYRLIEDGAISALATIFLGGLLATFVGPDPLDLARLKKRLGKTKR